MDRGLFQREVAVAIGVTANTITNWEWDQTTPVIRYWPGIIEWLGFVPFKVGESLPERIRAYRKLHGLTQHKLAQRLGVDESTVQKWEAGKHRPSRKHQATRGPLRPRSEPNTSNRRETNYTLFQA